MTKTKEQINYEVSQLVKQCPIILEAMKISREEGKAETLKEFKKFLIECEGEIIGKCFIKNGFSKWAKLQEVKII